MPSERRADWTWGIGLIALGLVVWAVFDFMRADRRETIRLEQTPPAAELPLSAADAVELHRLLPDATDDLGAAVRVDGTVATVPSGIGFWVRDLRDNLVHVAYAGGPEVGAPVLDLGPGDAVSVLGVVALLPPREAEQRLALGRPAPPPGGMLVQDVEVVAIPDGVRVHER